jgi:hypothetical protein
MSWFFEIAARQLALVGLSLISNYLFSQEIRACHLLSKSTFPVRLSSFQYRLFQMINNHFCTAVTRYLNRFPPHLEFAWFAQAKGQGVLQSLHLTSNKSLAVL